MTTTDKQDGTTARGSLIELKEQLQEYETVLLTTVTPEGLVRARPMAVQDPEELTDCDLWFVTSSDTGKVDEIARERQVGVCGYRPKYKGWLSISARATFDRDRALIRRLFKPDWKMWFANGPEDPDIVILKLEVERAEYWEPEGSRARMLYEVVKRASRASRPIGTSTRPSRCEGPARHRPRAGCSRRGQFRRRCGART